MIDIWTYIAARHPAAADRQLDRIESKLERLADFPYLGGARPELGQSIRSVSVGSYVLVYRPAERGIELTRVLHAARDLGAALLDPA